MIKIDLWNELGINKSSLKIKIDEGGILFSINKNNQALRSVNPPLARASRS
jgi:hypothetical protein